MRKLLSAIYREQDRNLFNLVTDSPSWEFALDNVVYTVPRKILLDASRSVLPPYPMAVDEEVLRDAINEEYLSAYDELETIALGAATSGKTHRRQYGQRQRTNVNGAATNTRTYGQVVVTHDVDDRTSTETTTSDPDVVTAEKSFSSAGGPYVEPVDKTTTQIGEKTVVREDEAHLDMDTTDQHVDTDELGQRTDTETNSSYEDVESDDVTALERKELEIKKLDEFYAVLRAVLTSAISQADPCYV